MPAVPQSSGGAKPKRRVTSAKNTASTRSYVKQHRTTGSTASARALVKNAGQAAGDIYNLKDNGAHFARTFMHTIRTPSQSALMREYIKAGRSYLGTTTTAREAKDWQRALKQAIKRVGR